MATTIRIVDKSTKQRMAKYGMYGDTYEKIIIRLMDKIEEQEKLLV